MNENSCTPPVSNTGVLHTSLNSPIALVDWVSVTFKTFQKWQNAAEVLKLDESTFEEMKQSMNGYKGHVRRGHISILFDGGNVDMGVHVIMSGQGCREFEVEHEGSWPAFFKDVFLYGGHFTRLDLAIDDYKGYFKPTQVVEKLETGLSSSKFKDYRYMKKGRILDGKSKGVTVYLGSDKSDVQIRIYDKLLERKEAGKEIDPSVKHWVRTELQLCDERADAGAQQVIYETYANGVNIGTVICGFLSNYVNFHEKPTGDSNKSRWPQWTRWAKFLGAAKKLKLSVSAPDRTIETRKAWISTQTAKTLGKIFLALNSDMDWFIELLEKGMDALDAKDLEEIETYKRNTALIELHNLRGRLDAAKQEQFKTFDEYLLFITHLQDKMRGLESLINSGGESFGN